MARGLHPCRRTEKLKERQSEKEIRQGSRDLNSSEPNSLAIQEREKPNISHTNDQFFSTKNDSQLQTNLQPSLPYKHGRNIHPCTRGERALYPRDLAVRAARCPVPAEQRAQCSGAPGVRGEEPKSSPALVHPS